MSKQIDIKKIIDEKQLKILFQPIVSTYQGKVAGVEALVRGIDEKDGSEISPFTLFAAARDEGLVIQLDRLCQKMAIERFSMIFREDNAMILFLNVDNSVIHLDKNTGAIYDYSLEFKVSPKKIVLEINELHSANLEAVVRFTKMYREKGFMISIDDIGSGYSNLDRIVLLQPDIIKIDRELIRDVEQHYYKQQVVEMVIQLAERTGALIVAEGVERMEEIMTVLQYGAHLLQGFYIAKPEDLDCERISEINSAVIKVANEQKAFLAAYMTDQCRINKHIRSDYEAIRRRVEYECSGVDEVYLSRILSEYDLVECAYVIGEDGKQKTDTIFCNSQGEVHHKTLFSPYRRGDDATLKAYYYVLKTTHQHLYVSEEYLSLATGNRCITVSGYCTLGSEHVILCLDIIKENCSITRSLKDYKQNVITT